MIDSINNLTNTVLNGSSQTDTESTQLSGTHFNVCPCTICHTSNFSSDGTAYQEDFQAQSPSFLFSNAKNQTKGQPITITYSFGNLFNGGIKGGINNAEMQDAIEESFELWAQYAPLNFVEVKDSGKKSRNNPNAADIRIGHDNLGGVGGTLGQARSQYFGDLFVDVVFDNRDQWETDRIGNKFDFLGVAVHEIGHALGLRHSNATSVMQPTAKDIYSGLGSAFLYQDDIDGIRSIYGKGKGSLKTLSGNPGSSKPEPAPQPIPEPNPSPSPTPKEPNSKSVILGTGGKDDLRGSARNQTIKGFGSNDKMYGMGGNDKLEGGLGNDKLFGGEGKDVLQGNSTWKGRSGKNEKDELAGGGGADTFVLGNKSTIFYRDGKSNTLGASDYALIKDFNQGQGDVIQLSGNASKYRLGNSPIGSGKGIFLKTAGQDELIGVVRGQVSNLKLNSKAFKYVGNSNKPSTPTPAPTPNPTPAPTPGPKSETDRFDQEVLKLVNQERTQRGLKPLTLNAKLDQAADKHSKDMAEKDFFSHTGKNGSSIGDRASAAGYQWSRLGENIAAGQRTPESVVQGWMNSSGHRANILNPNYAHMGLGYKSLSPDTGNVNYGRYWTQMFGASRGSSSNLTADTLVSSNDSIVSPDDSALVSEQEQSGYSLQDSSGGVELNEGSQLLSDLMNDYQLGVSFNQDNPFNSLATYNQAALSDIAKAQNLVGIYDQTVQPEING